MIGEKKDAWDDKWRTKVAYIGNKQKFAFRMDCRERLFKTLSHDLKGIVMASEDDGVWGIGFSLDDAMDNEGKWGLKLLGRVLERVRNKLFRTENPDLMDMTDEGWY